MPSLRILFPDKDSPSVISLRGNRITVGRLPDNTIQIPDRTVSGHHAELIAEGDHYRVHDVGATNGIQVNGQVVDDFHLVEACKVAFGGVECEFRPETPAEETVDPSRVLTSRAEADTLRQEVAMLRAQVAAYQHEAEVLKHSHVSQDGEASVSQAEFDRVTGELTGMALKVVEAERQVEQFRTDLNLLRRDRENLQRALDEARSKSAAQAAVPAEGGTDEAAENASVTAPAAPPPQVPDALPPVPSGSPVETPSPSPVAESPAADEPAAPSPAETLQEPRPKPLFVPGSGEQKPAAPRPQIPNAQPTRAPGQLQPAAIARAGMAGSGLRPASFGKPAEAPVAKPGVPVAKPAAPGVTLVKPGAQSLQGKPGLASRAGIPTKPPLAAAPKAVPAGAKPVAATAGPKGTQKLG